MDYNTTRLTPAECELIDWQHGQICSGFKQVLWRALAQADDDNLNRLSAGFPDLVRTLRRFRKEEGYYENVLKRAGIAPEVI